MTTVDRARLSGVHPRLVALIEQIFEIQQARQTPMFVVKGVRTQSEQQALYALGRTRSGRIVTMKDGVVHKSNHQPHADGYGHAVDCAFVGGDPFSDRTHNWEGFGELAEARGLTWGGRWSHPHDAPHIELP